MRLAALFCKLFPLRTVNRLSWTISYTGKIQVLKKVLKCFRLKLVTIYGDFDKLNTFLLKTFAKRYFSILKSSKDFYKVQKNTWIFSERSEGFLFGISPFSSKIKHVNILYFSVYLLQTFSVHKSIWLKLF